MNNFLSNLKEIAKKISIITTINLFVTSCSINFQAPIDDNITLPHSDKGWRSHLQGLQNIHSYQANGQFGIITAQDRYSSAFQWHYQSPTDSELHLSAFLNMASVKVMMTTNGLIIIDDQGKKHTHQQAQNLLDQLVGTPISLTELAQWLKGVPPQNASYKVGSNHLLKQFTYPSLNGTWKVNYLSYHQDLAIPMPKDILLINGNHQLKIRITQWQWENSK